MADIIEAGDYRAKAVEGKLTETKGGKAQAAVRFALLDFPGKAITWYGFLEASEAAFDIAMRGLRTAGFKGDDLADMSSLVEELAPEVILVVKHEEYQGKVSAKVAFINSLGGMAMQGALQPDQARSFADRMKGRVLAFNQAAGLPATKPNGVTPKASTKAMPLKPSPRPVPASASEVPLDLLDAQADQVDEDRPF